MRTEETEDTGHKKLRKEGDSRQNLQKRGDQRKDFAEERGENTM